MGGGWVQWLKLLFMVTNGGSNDGTARGAGIGTATMNVLPPPNLLGAPDRYTKWRNMQAEAVLAAADSTKRFVVQGAPTAFGKSLSYVCTGLLTDARTVILTSTKALMRQVHTDFAPSGMIEIRGLNSYECLEGRPTGRFGDVRREGYRADRGLPMMCDEAPCQAGAFCLKRNGGCLYYDAYSRAIQPTSKLIVTNYAYWMSINKHGEGLGKVDLLVLDEAHAALDELGNHIGTELRPSEVEAVLPGEGRVLQPGAEQDDWIAWAGYWHGKVAASLESIRQAIKESDRSDPNRSAERLNHSALRRARDLRRLQHRLETIASMSGDWIIDWTEDKHRRPVIKFDPVWPSEYAEGSLFLNVPKIVLVSATVTSDTAGKLGIPRGEFEFKEYPSPIPKDRRPFIYIPTAHMNYRSAKEGMREISVRCDQIIGRRTDRKAIIQTVSYQRAMDIYAGSTFKTMMLLHDSDNTAEIIDVFKRSTKPLILVSPVLDTGYDFPYAQAEYQILVKMPFPMSTDKVLKARMERDKGYRDYVTMVKLVQMAGRIARAEDDTGETFMLDSDFGWWYFGRNGDGPGVRLCPYWFKESVRVEQMLGSPPHKLTVV